MMSGDLAPISLGDVLTTGSDARASPPA